MKARTAEEITAGLRNGRVIFTKTCRWDPPRSKAASSWVRSNRWTLAMISSMQYALMKVACPMMAVQRPPLT